MDGKQGPSLGPEIFEPVERPLVDGEDVDDDPTIVEEDPASGRRPFRAIGANAALGQLVQHLARDRPELPLVLAGAEDEVVGDGGDLLDVQHEGIARGRVPDDVRYPQRQPAAAADRPCTQSPIADEPYGSVLVFRDPDNIQLELAALTDPS